LAVRNFRNSSVPGNEISECAPCQEDDDSDSSQIWDAWRHLSFVRIAAVYDSSEQCTKHGNGRDCAGKRVKDLCKCGVHFLGRSKVDGTLIISRRPHGALLFE